MLLFIKAYCDNVIVKAYLFRKTCFCIEQAYLEISIYDIYSIKQYTYIVKNEYN